ncbi:denitrification regulatory protein nirq [Stagonosporopsis vannaccii]|nr:denitrification regulatory protein nirq [Stagonosporopsis vannaccii]
MIEYLAKRSGNTFVRINNHEHTDLQEYLGSYVSGADGKLTFQEGILVRALREGHWIVLDELNLAPTDVLEALNRLLDDNRELLIPETQEVVRPHEDFMLFATQNPAGLYGGRKVLSRAFRNRFLELHFDDIPVEELKEILHRRVQIPESWCAKIVQVYKELSTLRQENRIFEQKSFATLRDLFRWAQRKAETIQDLAVNGYMLLAERVRKEEERVAVKKIMETVLSKNGPRVVIDDGQLFSQENVKQIIDSAPDGVRKMDAGVVWTRAMRRLFVLVRHAMVNNEPVLLIGETGCGKTTVCQMLADAFGKELHILNAHQNTETGDLIGAQRPIRNRAAIEDTLRRDVLEALEGLPLEVNPRALDLNALLHLYDEFEKEASVAIRQELRVSIQVNRVKAGALFEWADGSLVNAMKTGQYFLLDEISLADDSVLERLNSILEPSRTLLLAEKGPVDSLVVAGPEFQFLATMNPGGDYGKKELSPALRNRFTEIWVPALSDLEDVLQIVKSKLNSSATQYAKAIVLFSKWFNDKYNTSVASSISIRDTLAWVTFVNSTVHEDPAFGIVHGAAMVFIDTLGANPAGLLAISAASINDERRTCLEELSKLLQQDISPLYFGRIDIISSAQTFQLGSFSIPKFSSTATEADNFALEAPTTRGNAMRVVRALQLAKPILLEGNPGVGKTTLITALAKAIGKPLTRLNLSEQTDLMDLFGSDVPVEGGAAGTFAWRDAPFLKAMKSGDWVLLDEMNLASQSVLEGLNAVLDHRGEVYISELDQTFHKHQDFRVFAAQNPHHQGGGRKGLPASFVNRFTVVYADVFRPEDLTLICKKVFSNIGEEEINKLIGFVAQLDEQVVTHRAFGNLGAPWEFNLRDTLRWLQLLASSEYPGTARDFLDAIFVQRFRAEGDRARLLRLFNNIYGAHEPRLSLYHNFSPKAFQVGLGLLHRDAAITQPTLSSALTVSQLGPMETLLISVKQNWPVLLVGPPGCGKTMMINQLASFVGAELVTFSMNADVDAMDLVGGYEQIDPSRQVHQCMEKLETWIRREIALSEQTSQHLVQLLEHLQVGVTRLTDDFFSSLLQEAAAHGIEAANLANRLHNALSSANQQMDGARFQWVDGILIRALEQGKWLVLDNANLCSSAVLDRLNSLLEPNGYLSINEHSTANGEARIVRPHPDFRIFMTMDPRFGELSRAMRNRAVEICVIDSEHIVNYPSVIEYPLESAMYRFRQFLTHEGTLDQTLQSRFENLSFTDNNLIESFAKQARLGLVTQSAPNGSNGSSATSTIQLTAGAQFPHSLDDNFARFVSFINKVWARKMQTQLESDSMAELLPIHPLGNEFSVNRSTAMQANAFQYSQMYDLMLDMFDMQQGIHTLPSAKFERRKERQKLPAFLHSFWQALVKLTEGIWALHNEARYMDLSFLKPLRNMFWAFYALAKGSAFDRATFQTYLKMLNSSTPVVSSESHAMVQTLATVLSKQIATFGADVQLTTGLSMEPLWRHLKPNTPRSMKDLEGILRLEALADRLDAIMWKSDLNAGEMIQIRERFASSLQLVRGENVAPDELIAILDNAVREIEESIGDDDATITPYFEEEFEGLCQLLDVAVRQDGVQYVPDNASPALFSARAKAALFARRPTKLATIAVGKAQSPTDLFAKVHRHVGLIKEPADSVALQSRFHIAMLAKLHGADEVQLTQLARFETELQVLSQQLALDAEKITNDQNEALDTLYLDLWRAIDLSIPGVLHTKIRASSKATGREWIELALVGLGAYVPNYPHDPALRPMIERKMFNEQKSSLLIALSALREFQSQLTGQDTSLRIRQVEAAIQSMGEEPPVPAIARPEESQLDELQGEFTNLLSIVQPLFSKSMSASEAALDVTLHQNVVRVIQRLAEGYRAYDDITDTVIGLLACLYLGLLLAKKEHDREEHSKSGKSLQYLAYETPFFGLHNTKSSIDTNDLIQSAEEALARSNSTVDCRWHALYVLSVVKSTDPVAMSHIAARGLLHGIFTSFFTEYKTKLLKDQEKEAQDKSLYSYRGMEEEENDEEDRTLFPDYEAEQEDEDQAAALTVQSEAQATSRDYAIRLANIHNELFLEGQEASDSMKILIEWSAIEMNRIASGKSHGTTHEDAMPALYLALEKKTDALNGSGTGPSYNFYFDANLPEAKRLITFVHRIQARYRQIRNVWPEHMTLTDVLRTCDETLAFRHVDPVAKFITKAEKLYAYMYEWQRVASKQYSTADLFDDLTKLLVSWRQLELTTWARLFDLEVEKCRDSAKSWFFIAYESIIAASESIENEQAMRLHAKELLKSLEGFFESTTLGQFEQRIKLLRQLRQHAAMRMQDNENFQILLSALDNFIAYFSRLEKPVHEALAKGRQTLEKDVNNVIKLASWKDTNIEALKQSAKISHRKLSRLVRKFRTVLNKPVSGVISAGFADDGALQREASLALISATTKPEALACCETIVPGWTDRPTRFKNLHVTINMMRNLSSPGDNSVDGAAYIQELINSIVSSIIELQKATPSTLTEDNKTEVQQLKTQKRKLYADTMKELRQMGVKSNLSVDTLVKQDELSTVLSALPLIRSMDVGCGRVAEGHLHQALNLMPQVRAVSREHSGDLTSNDVAKSIGYIEGLLHISIKQREVLSRASQLLEGSKTPLAIVANLWQPEGNGLKAVSSQKLEASQSLQPSLRWLVAALKTGTDVIAAQAKLGKTNELDTLLKAMRERTVKLEDLAESYDKLPILPVNVISDARHAFEQSVQNAMAELRGAFQGWNNNEIARTVLKHIVPFIFHGKENAAQLSSNQLQHTVEQCTKNIFSALDSILGSMQDVEGALKEVPASTEDAAWLVKEGQSLASAISGLHAVQIRDALQSILDNLQYLHGDDQLRGIAAVFAVIEPVLSQYIASYQYLVDRFDALHASTTNLLYRLCKSFIQVGTQGFCQPPEKSSDQQKGKDDKLEEGTGLGEGEGAEDISKDIEEDEDLEDLAQEKGEREGSIEEEDDAVDMGENDMEGQTEEIGEKEDKGDEEGEEGDDDVQSEVGSVDDLGPSAVDEKMWDEGGKDDDAKDKEGKQDVGTEDQEEQVASEQKEKEKDEAEEEGKEEDRKEGQDGEEDEEMEGEDQEENVGAGETEQMDPHAKEEETLDLPEDLNMDGQDDEGGNDDDLNDMDMDDDLPEDEVDPDMGPDAQPDIVDEKIGSEEESEEDKDTTGHVQDEEQPAEDEEQEGDEPMHDDALPLPDENMPDDEPRDQKDTDQTDPNAEAGAGTEANEEAHQNLNEQASASAANRDEGDEGDGSDQKQDTAAEDGTLGQTTAPDAGGRGEEPEQSKESQSFKKLGDVLEKWYNQQKQISEAQEKDETQIQQIDKEIEMADADFEHLQDEEQQADTQALGTATEEQAKALDHDMAMPINEKEDEEKLPSRPEDNDQDMEDPQDIEMNEADSKPEAEQEEQQPPPGATDGQPQVFIGDQKPFANDDDADMADAMLLDEDASDAESVAEVDHRLETTHLDATAMDPATARSLWIAHESATHSLSQQLTESLRLILAPTLATKLRGDFRTGKRLNLKRIIPYIASGYKRDKIWLRRSQPSKRSYQVMIALDDSRSMADSGASNLALKTLTLVTRSLAMLEVGEVSVVGFGDSVNVAHDFDKPFTSEAGVRVFEQFGFDAAKTNVRGLVDKSLDLFAEARHKGSSSTGEDLWQLMLVVSDGICDSHAEIQRLVRKAQEERVMIVFIIIDATATAPFAAPVPNPGNNPTAQPEASEKEQDKTSILDLQSVEITPEGKVVRWKYMERFPFRYYLVVRDVRELPGVLAGALRQWFGEIAGSTS